MATHETEAKDSLNLTSDQKKKLKVVFITIFLDLVGFAIIFPLIPQLTKYYTEKDQANFFLEKLWRLVDVLASMVGHPVQQGQQIVLFGCLLGAIYSLLQFFASPLWGNLSDKIGRRKVLLTTLMGMVLSYLLWFFSGSFTLLVIARLIGGLSSGNISVASAVVADITNRETRSKGMAVIGIAFALGFVFGPAIGGILGQINLLQYYPLWADVGVNPFSLPALFALCLAVINWIFAFINLPETKESKLQDIATDTSQAEAHYRTFNIFKIFSTFSNSPLGRTNYTYFIFIALFAGMEFTLTFLTVERLDFSPKENGFLFVYIGFLIAMIQGGFVRRRAHIIGEKKVAFLGLCLLVPGLLVLANVQSLALLLTGLFFLASGSAMAVPTLTSMVSLLAPPEEQGKALGVFRSLGALGRIIGPLWASLIFWRFGSAVAYLCGALLISAPLYLLSRVPFKK